MANASLVSVIIPVYNCEKYLAEAIESALAQTYRSLEVIVVDDGSTDSSAIIAKAFPVVRYYFQPNAGLGATRNRGIELAQGSFLAFLDADDRWLEDKLARQMATFRTNPELDMVFGYVRQFHSPELEEATKARIGHAGEILPGYFAGTLMIRRASFFRVGPFATHWHVGEFIDWYLQAQEKGLTSTILPAVVMERRLHGTNMSLRERDSRTDYVRMLKASLDRRRGKELESSR